MHPELLKAIDEMGFTHASEIQNLTLTHSLAGKDIFAQAKTGSGKTVAFVVPILQNLLTNPELEKKPSHALYVILSPTRELAQQTHAVCEKLGKPLGVQSSSVIGGESIERQTDIINKGVDILVATPGRLVDLLKQKIVNIEGCRGVVFDEADRLFDMGFKKDIEFILSKAPNDRQLLMYSATNNQDVLRTAYKFHSDPLELKVDTDDDSLIVDKIDHKLAMLSSNEKFAFLVHQLRQKEDAYTIVFCNTQFQTHMIAEWLKAMGFKAKAISGKLSQNKRTRLMEEFKSKQVTTLVCTDVAARGLDIKDVNLVINYDLPNEAANYVHRIGRTGRAGESGEAISFCAHEDCQNLDAIYEFIGKKIPKMDISDDDFAKDLCKRPYLDMKTFEVEKAHPMNNRPERNNNRSSKHERKERTNRTNHSTEAALAPTEKRERREKRSYTGERVDRRFFQKSAYNVAEVKKEAMQFLRLNDENLLHYKVLEEGKKKFWIFGPKLTTYQFSIKPIFKRLLLPFLIELIKKSPFDLYVKVSYKPNTLYVNFSGKDEKLLVENRYAMLNAFEQIIRTYLQSRIVLPNDMKMFVRCQKRDNSNNRKEQNSDKWLQELAEKTRKELDQNKKEVFTKELNPAHRRIIHQYFQELPNYQTESIGDGRFKKIRVFVE